VTSGGDRAGVVLREASHEDTPLGNEIKAAIKAKVTVPDNLTVQARALRARCR
jgi:adenylate kinase family enzyme